jgi:hypothetical protein
VPSQQTLLQQVPEQQLLSFAQELPVAEQTQVPLEQIPEQQSLWLVHPISSFTIQATQVEVLVSQTRFGQQSFVLSQPVSPVGIQLTHLPVVLSQFCEQHSASLEQRPSFAIQQVPVTHVCAAEHLETQPPVPSLHIRHRLSSQGAGRQIEPQTFAGAQHVALGRPLLRQISSESQHLPLQHRAEQQVFPVQLPPAAVHGVTHWPFWQFWPEAQQCAPV